MGKLYFTVVFLILLTSSEYCYATHLAGGSLTYTWVSDSTYKLYFTLYRDCSGIAAPMDIDVCYSNSCRSGLYDVLLNSMTLTPAGQPNGIAINPDCPNYPTTCSGGTFPNYQEWWYTGVVTLPLRCSKWTFGVVLNTRNANDNLQNASSNTFYVEATLNNVLAPGNNSASFTIKPEPFVCDNQPYVYNNGAVDIDNDSLGYEIIQPEEGTTSAGNTCAVVTGIPFSIASPPYNLYNNPLPCNNTFTLDPVSGEMFFTPNLIGSYTVTCRITEYRRQTEIASVMRDMQVHVINCGIAAPDINIDSNTVTLINGKISDRAGTPLHFCFTAISTNPNAVLIPTDNHSLSAPGSSVSYSGIYSHTLYGCFNWLPALPETGIRVFNISVADSSCNLPGVIITNTCSIPLYIYMPSSGINNLYGSCNITVFPNPTLSIIHIDAPVPVNAAVTTMEGTLLMRLQNVDQADISSFAAGIYLVKITDVNGQLLKVEKIVKLQ